MALATTGFIWLSSKNGGCAFELQTQLLTLAFSVFQVRPVILWDLELQTKLHAVPSTYANSVIPLGYDIDLFCYVYLPFIMTVLSQSFENIREGGIKSVWERL